MCQEQVDNSGVEPSYREKGVTYKVRKVTVAVVGIFQQCMRQYAANLQSASWTCLTSGDVVECWYL